MNGAQQDPKMTEYLKQCLAAVKREMAQAATRPATAIDR